MVIITPRQREILDRIEAEVGPFGVIGVSHLGRCLGISKVSAHEAVKALCRKGLMQRVPLKADSPHHVYKLTSENVHFERLYDVVDEAVAALIAAGKDDLAKLLRQATKATRDVRHKQTQFEPSNQPAPKAKHGWGTLSV